jgi:hypothetical protein
MLLTHYKSAHAGPTALQYAMSIPIESKGYETLIDIGIIDQRDGRMLAFFEILFPGEELTDFATRLSVAKGYVTAHPWPDRRMHLGVVAPESRAGEVERLGVGRETLVTYPA